MMDELFTADIPTCPYCGDCEPDYMPLEKFKHQCPSCGEQYIVEPLTKYYCTPCHAPNKVGGSEASEGSGDGLSKAVNGAEQ